MYSEICYTQEAVLRASCSGIFGSCAYYGGNIWFEWCDPSTFDSFLHFSCYSKIPVKNTTTGEDHTLEEAARHWIFSDPYHLRRFQNAAIRHFLERAYDLDPGDCVRELTDAGYLAFEDTVADQDDKMRVTIVKLVRSLWRPGVESSEREVDKLGSFPDFFAIHVKQDCERCEDPRLPENTSSYMVRE